MIGLLRSLFFNVAFFAWTTLLAVLYLPTLVLPRVAILRGIRFWVRGVFVLQGLIGQRIVVRGRARLPRAPYIVASKHQSAWDTLVFNLALDDPAFVVKRELLAIPLFGWELRRADMIAVDRAGGAAALRALVRRARAVAGQGRPIVIFPEGTRTRQGARAPYHPGIAALYGALGLSVIPVALNSGMMWPRRGFARRAGTIILEFLPAIPPGLEREVLLDRLREGIEGASSRLAEEATGARDKPVDNRAQLPAAPSAQIWDES
ncbi:MAG: 1-acyl-sn-glycerol-3-phosphate acyltransferase [Alphaproteobacteria bacterium]|nr:1-acyl-sn-glycerol-3-phosphate acyltransferase [Alphaproteobacteria bacterium]